MTGAEFENQAHLQSLSLGGQAAEQTSTNKDTVNRMVSYVKMLSHRKTRQVFLDALKVLGETIDIDGWATAAGDTVDLARCLAGKSLHDDNGGSRALEIGGEGDVVTGMTTGVRAWGCK